MKDMMMMRYFIVSILLLLISHVSSFQNFYLNNVINNLQHRQHSGTRSIKTTTAVTAEKITWSPQDLTKDIPGYPKIPNDDYIKKYQENPEEYWPIEFFIIVYRRIVSKRSKRIEILVRPSANGTSKYGLGTGVPLTRWMPSSPSSPYGYTAQTKNNKNNQKEIISFDARNFNEFPEDSKDTWSYTKIDIDEDAFHNKQKENLIDSELEEYARQVHHELKKHISFQMKQMKKETWEYSRLSLIQNSIEKPNCIAAIQGNLRMSGLFAYIDSDNNKNNNKQQKRFVNLSFSSHNKSSINPKTLVKSMRIYTMFPQMPDPLPNPFTTSSKELQTEIETRPSRMEKTGRNSHQDVYGRKYTHISTSNVSNTIHGIYFSLDVTDLLSGLDKDNDHKDTSSDIVIPPALDLFGTKRVQKEWVSLQDLKVLDHNGEEGTQDTKPTFISGFIVRQLVKEGVIG